jgi:hypothetical protein
MISGIISLRMTCLVRLQRFTIDYTLVSFLLHHSRMFEHDDETNPRGLGGGPKLKRIITMLRVWYRKAIRRLTESLRNTRGVSVRLRLSNYVHIPRLADAPPLRLAWNHVLEDRSAKRARFS